MKYLLDTNALIALLRGTPRFIRRVRRRMPRDFGISSIALHELYYGAYKSARVDENLARIDSMRIVVLPFDTEDARQAGEIRSTLARAGKPIGPYDALSAAQAKARGLTLITHNVGEFSRVAGLRVEDWEG